MVLAPVMTLELATDGELATDWVVGNGLGSWRRIEELRQIGELATDWGAGDDGFGSWQRIAGWQRIVGWRRIGDEHGVDACRWR